MNQIIRRKMYKVEIKILGENAVIYKENGAIWIAKI